MPAVAAFPSVPSFIVAVGFGSEGGPEPQGEAGIGLLRNAKEVYRQWNEPTEVLHAVGDDGDEVPDVSLALKPAFYVKVRYKYTGKMKSVPYPFDD